MKGDLITLSKFLRVFTLSVVALMICAPVAFGATTEIIIDGDNTNIVNPLMSGSSVTGKVYKHDASAYIDADGSFAGYKITFVTSTDEEGAKETPNIWWAVSSDVSKKYFDFIADDFAYYEDGETRAFYYEDPQNEDNNISYYNSGSLELDLSPDLGISLKNMKIDVVVSYDGDIKTTYKVEIAVEDLPEKRLTLLEGNSLSSGYFSMTYNNLRPTDLRNFVILQAEGLDTLLERVDFTTTGGYFTDYSSDYGNLSEDEKIIYQKYAFNEDGTYTLKDGYCALLFTASEYNDLAAGYYPTSVVATYYIGDLETGTTTER